MSTTFAPQRVLHANPPIQGVSTVLNVLQRVGPGEPNQAADVRLLQRLLQLAEGAAADRSGIAVPAVTGRFDAATGFWIFRQQVAAKRVLPGCIVDGVVSPARGSLTYGPRGEPWTIVLLNLFAKKAQPGPYAALVAAGGQV